MVINTLLKIPCTIPVFFIFLLAYSPALTLANPTLSAGFLLSGDESTIFFDDAEDGSCPRLPWWSNGSGATCKAAGRGDVEVLDRRSKSGQMAYYFPGLKPANWSLGDANLPISTAKLPASELAFKAFREDINSGMTAGFSAQFFVESGFNDDSWHIQMQWKGQPDDWYAADYFNPWNPKLSWGVHYVNNKRVIMLRIREPDPKKACKVSYDSWVSDLEVPFRKWFNVKVEIKAHETEGYVKIWQQNDGDQEVLILHVKNINTFSQLADPYHKSNVNKDVNAVASERKCWNPNEDIVNPAHGKQGRLYVWFPFPTMSFWVANYLDTGSYAKPNQENHVIWADDIHVYYVKD